MPDDIELRPLATTAERLAAVDLQRATWGRDFSDVVPASLLKVTQKVGGVAAGAFAADGHLLGFVYGLSGVVDGRPAHWSHMLAVAPGARDRGLGLRLKLYQRELLLAQGVEVVRWTFDPLEARNAHLNLNRLGAGIESYVPDMYAGEFGSELAEGIGTDRFIVAWEIAGARVDAALAGALPRAPERFDDAPIVAPGRGDAEPSGGAPRVRIEVPRDVQTLKGTDPDLAAAFRATSRRAFLHYLGVGYRITAMLAEGDRRYYALEWPVA